MTVAPHKFQQHSRESGQSLVGTMIVGLFVLVPVFLLIPLLGKYISLQETALQAARNAAFERTIYSESGSRNSTTVAQKSNQSLEQQVQSRFFSSLDQDIQSNHSPYSTQSLWSGTAGHPLLPSYQDVTVALTESASPDLPDQVLQPALNVFDPLSAGGPASALNFKGLFTAVVHVTPRAVSFPFLQPLHLDFTARDALLADGWDSSGSPDVKKQLQATLPFELPALRTGLSLFDSGAVEDLDGLHLEKVLTNTPSEVPSDHLQPYHP